MFQVFTYSLTLCLSLVIPHLNTGGHFHSVRCPKQHWGHHPRVLLSFPFPPTMMRCQIVSALIVPMSFSSPLPLSSSFLDSVLLSSPSSPQKLGKGFSNVSDALLWQLPRCLVYFRTVSKLSALGTRSFPLLAHTPRCCPLFRSVLWTCRSLSHVRVCTPGVRSASNALPSPALLNEWLDLSLASSLGPHATF